MIQHYVKFWHAGSFCSEDMDKKIKSREDKIIVPQGYYAYQFFDREETKGTTGTLYGKEKNFSGWYFVGGELYDVERVKKEVPDSRILVSNMEGNNWPMVIKCNQGFLPFNPKKDKIVERGE
jgi:hypothetical protein